MKTVPFYISILFFFLYSSIGGLELETYNVRDVLIKYPPKDSKLVRELGNEILKDIDDFQRTISFYPDIQASIVVAPDDEYYRKLTSKYSGIIEFSEAFYSGVDKTIYIKNPRDLKSFSGLRKVVLHEYIHFFIDSLFDGVPLWFHEGMAVYFSEGIRFERELNFAKEHLLGNTLPLSEMVNDYPPNMIQWESFYMKSALAVKYLFSKQQEDFYRFWELSTQTRSFQTAFLHSFMTTPAMFSNRFEEQLTKRYRIEILLSFTGLIWAVLPLVLLIAWIKRKMVAHKVTKKWELELKENDLID